MKRLALVIALLAIPPSAFGDDTPPGGASATHPPSPNATTRIGELEAVSSKRTCAAGSTCPSLDLTAPNTAEPTSDSRHVAVNVRLSHRPETRVAIDFDSNDGRSFQLVWDPQQVTGLNRTLQLPVSERWFVSAEGTRATLPSADGKSALFYKYVFDWAASADATTLVATGTIRQLDIGTTTEWKDIPGAEQLTIEVSQPRAAEALRTTQLAPDFSSSARGLDSAVPEAVKDALQILAEIAVERAKAEGIRIIKDKIVTYVCTDLTLKAVFPTLGGREQLLPSTCGQLENMRITDLGSSATGLLDAIREDIVGTVLPYVVKALEGQIGVGLTKLAPTADAVFEIVNHAIRRGLRVEDLKLAILAIHQLTGATDIPRPFVEWQPAFEIALLCAEQSCSISDLEKFLPDFQQSNAKYESARVAFTQAKDELKTAKQAFDNLNVAAVPASATKPSNTPKPVDATMKQAAQQAVAAAKTAVENAEQELAHTAVIGSVAHRTKLIRYAVRLLGVLQPPPNSDPNVIAGQLIDTLLDMAREGCEQQEAGCVAAINGMRDVAVGLVEKDYLRSLGGVSTLLKASGAATTLKGKPLELLATVSTYIQTYRDTKDKDPETAHRLRKEALEGLIDAATDRTNRDGDTIVSLGTSVGFTAGTTHILYGIPKADDDKAFHDLRLPLGLTVQHLHGPKDNFLERWIVHVSFADLAQFVSSPVTGTDTKTMQETKWSDFVSPGLQAGFRFFNKRIPLVLGLDASFVPRVTLSKSDGTSFDTSVFRFGVFAGFNVTFFDLN